MARRRSAATIVVAKPEYIDGTATPLEIAPDLAHMTAYRDPGIQFGDYRDIKKGPCHFTLELSQLKPGKHTLEFWINDFGGKHAIGSFEISGDDYSAYADLHAGIKEEVSGGRRLPAARKTDKAMAETMVALLKNAGWAEVLRLNIVDQDWWIDRVAGARARSSRATWRRPPPTRTRMASVTTGSAPSTSRHSSRGASARWN